MVAGFHYRVVKQGLDVTGAGNRCCIGVNYPIREIAAGDEGVIFPAEVETELAGTVVRCSRAIPGKRIPVCCIGRVEKLSVPRHRARRDLEGVRAGKGEIGIQNRRGLGCRRCVRVGDGGLVFRPARREVIVIVGQPKVEFAIVVSKEVVYAVGTE